MINKKKQLTIDDRDLFLRALDEFRRTGKNSVRCNSCGVPLRFSDVNSATKHECDCGKFNGVLRGF